MKAWNRVRTVVLAVVFAVVAAAAASMLLRPAPLEPVLPAPLLSVGDSPDGWEVDRGFIFKLAEGEASSSRARYLSKGGTSSLQIEIRYALDIRKMFTADDAVASLFVPEGFMPLDIQTHYLIDDLGNIQGNARDAAPSLKPAEVRQESGSQCFWGDRNRFHLSAVICPGGDSVVTRKAFSHQLYSRQFHPRELLAGKRPVFDSRSIIVDISAKTDLPEEEARQQLQQAWHEWQPWCRTRL